MAENKRHWLWNLLIVVTGVVCILAFIAHSKNWTKIEGDHIRILSGLYYKELKFSEIDSIKMVDKIPQLERINGFSAWAMEKGIFRDSLKPENKVRIYIDNLRQPKIKLIHNDSLKLFLNFSDSTETQQMYQFFLGKMNVANTQFSESN
jgi:hypothetical protein